MPFTIVAENCTGCTACEKRCPTKAISGDPKKAYYIEATLCIDCGACGVICPDEAILDTWGNVTKVLKRQERPIAVVHPDNCNGCGVCVDVCPARSKSEVKHKALNMEPAVDHRDEERPVGPVGALE